jgi:hypothetical protein
MPRVGFEPTIPVFERTKTVHALKRAATVIGPFLSHIDIKIHQRKLSTLCCDKSMGQN